MVLKYLVHLLNKRESSKQPAHSVNGHGLIVTFKKLLKGAHGVNGKKN